MADINTSIKIEADASQAVSEMQRLSAATEKLKRDGENVVIAPKVQGAGAAAALMGAAGTTTTIPLEVDTSKLKAATAQATDAVSLVAQQYQNVATSANVAQSSGEQAGQGIASSSTEAAASVSKVNDTLAEAYIKIKAAENAQKAYNFAINEGKSETEATEAATRRYNLTIQDKIKDFNRAAQGERNWAAEAAKSTAATDKSTAAIKANTAAAKENAAAGGGIRGAFNSALEGYRNFSTGASGGVEKFKSLSLNLLADLELLQRVAVKSFNFGKFLTESYFETQRLNKELELSAVRTSEIEAKFIKLSLAVKSPTQAVEQLNAKIAEIEAKIADYNPYANFAGFGTQVQADFTKIGEQQRKGLQTQVDGYKKVREEAQKLVEDEIRRRGERSGLALLDEETKLRKTAEYEIADLETQLWLEQDERIKASIRVQIENRKKVLEKDLNDFKENEKKKAEEEAKRRKEAEDRERERIARIADEYSRANIANLEGDAKIRAQAAFDLAQLQERLAEAKTEQERGLINGLIAARKKAESDALQAYADEQKKRADEAAEQAKQKAREAADYQRSILEDIRNYQRQLVGQFSGLGQSIFPKEAMSYLRQIAGASNKFPP